MYPRSWPRSALARVVDNIKTRAKDPWVHRLNYYKI